MLELIKWIGENMVELERDSVRWGVMPQREKKNFDCWINCVCIGNPYR